MPIPSLAYGPSEASDCGVFVGVKADLTACEFPFAADLSKAASLDNAIASGANLIASSAAPGGRLVFVCTGPLNRDYDDARRIADAVKNAVKRAIAAGSKQPTLFLSKSLNLFKEALPLSLQSALGACYAPLSTREFKGETAAEPVTSINFLGLSDDAAVCARAAEVAAALEAGRRVAKDVGGGDPERMAPPKAVAYIEETFKAFPQVKVSVVDDMETIRTEYPLTHAVARASLPVSRHHPRIMRLELSPEGPVERQVYLVGKGVTYDTGGVDVKTGGNMVGMSRDKCGAASAAGFLCSVAMLKPKGLRVVLYLSFVRNSIGSEAWVADEIILSHAGVRVLTRNTDAEGRFAMADSLSHVRAEVLAQPTESRPPTTVHTIATLTGHVVIAYGLGYSAALDNGPARAMGVAQGLQAAGHEWADPFEVSTVRREDFDFVAPKTSEYDVLQVNNAPSSQTPRGHQFPAAFLTIAAGLDKHGSDSADPIAYTHLDVAASTVAAPYLDGVTTGAPVNALTAYYAGL